MSNSIIDDIKFRIVHGNNSLLHLIAINVALFLLMAIPLGIISLFGLDKMNSVYGWVSEWFFLPGTFSKFITRPWTLVTHFFMHSFGIGHILWNMLFLWWFGQIYHNLMGNQRTIQLYVLSGLTGGVAFLLANQMFPVLSAHLPLVGASGAVTGFIVAATVLAPNYSIRLLFFGNIKLWMIAAFFIISDIIFLSENSGGNIAHLAGGFMGYFFVAQLRKGRDFGSWISKTLLVIKAFFEPRPQSNFKVHQNKSRSGGASSAERFSQEVSQEEIDFILDKIAKSGYESLSKREKDILFKASDKN